MNNKTTSGSYNDVYGHFDFEFLYDEIAKQCYNGATICEVGVAFGRSLMYMMERLKFHNKNVNLYGIDFFKQDDDINEMIFEFDKPILGKDYRKLYNDETLYYDAIFNIQNSIASEKKPFLIKSESSLSSALFADNSVFFCFLDASHEYNNVKNDIEKWYPKIHSRGIIAGHDYEGEKNSRRENGVAKAAHEFFWKDNLNFDVFNTTWIMQKP